MGCHRKALQRSLRNVTGVSSKHQEKINLVINLLSLLQESVSLSQFTDMLTGRGASKEDCLEVC